MKSINGKKKETRPQCDQKLKTTNPSQPANANEKAIQSYKKNIQKGNNERIRRERNQH